MKTKEEMLEIYSTYLPYNLNCMCIDSELSNGWDKYSSYKKGFVFEMDNQDLETEVITHFKPILYPLDMLTKEIENRGQRFIPIEKFEITDDSDSYPIEYDHGNIKLIKNLESIAKNNSYFDIQFLPFELVTRLISWHLNVFGLQEGEYIRKSNI